MSAVPQARSGRFLAALAVRAERWLLEPAAPQPRVMEPRFEARPVIAVVGLAPRCGTTTVARALAIELARRDASGAAFVSARSRAQGPALATAAARRLARGLRREVATATGRLCLLDHDDPAVRELARGRPAPLVLDVEHGRAPQAAVALADHTVLVADPRVEPALGDVVAAALARGDERPQVVLNRVHEEDTWHGRDVLRIGEVRLGSRLALAGRDPVPGLGRPVAQLADGLVGEAPA